MDPQAQASFIPKKPLVASASARGGMGILWFIGLLLFVFSAISAGGAFGYEKYLEGQIASASDSLQRAQAAFDPQVIADIIRLNNRIDQSNILLHNHVSPSAVFTLLEQTTLSTVRFTSFEYDLSPNGAATLSLDGEALDFPSVALQSDAFGQTRALKDVLFSDINVDPGTGHITFKVSATIDPSQILYSNLLAGGGIPQSGTASSSVQSAQSQTSTQVSSETSGSTSTASAPSAPSSHSTVSTQT